MASFRNGPRWGQPPQRILIRNGLHFLFCLMFDSDQPEDALRPYFVLEYVSTRKMDLTGCRTIEDLKEEEIASCYPAASTR